MRVNEMKTIPLEMDGNVTLVSAQEKARATVAADHDNLRLIAWYDRGRSTGGPMEACAGEVPKCIRDYAASHEGERRVWVNDGAYEFYFSPTGKDVEELDREWALRVHEGANRSDFDDVQGG